MGKRLIIPGADFSANAIEQEPLPGPVDYTLQNGYASVYATTVIILDQGASVDLRVRTSEIFGPYSVKTKPGYVIRAIATYKTALSAFTPGEHTTTGAVAVPDVQGLTEYTLNEEDCYSIITFCKTDATAEISASEDIVDYIIEV